MYVTSSVQNQFQIQEPNMGMGKMYSSPDGVTSRDFISICVKELVNGSVEVSVMGGVKVGNGAGRQAKTTEYCESVYVCVCVYGV